MALLIPVEEEDFKSKVKIRFNDINTGFSEFNNSVLEADEQAYINFFQQAVRLNGEENTYIDFYYNRLDDKSKENLKSMIDEEERVILEQIEQEIKGNEIYYNLTYKAVPFIVRLCTREILFSTFYFTKYPCTIWGNYNNKFPIFYKQKNLFTEYIDILEYNRIKINL